MKKLFIDLGAGLGGASEAFIECENWEVLRFDIAEEVKDVQNMHLVDYVNNTSKVIDMIRNKIK